MTSRGGHMAQLPPEPEALLTPAEVAALFRVDPKNVPRWAKAGKLCAIRTLGGHRRYRAAEVQALLDGLQGEVPPPAPPAPQPPMEPPPQR
jgi:excisionase family DNA binding protein